MQLLNFACSWFGLLFVDYAMMFTSLKGKKNVLHLDFYFKIRVPM
jgi:hypothetical protein